MKRINFVNLFLLLVLTFVFSCREDINITDSNKEVEPPEIIVNASVTGIVVDGDENPISDAVVRIGSIIQETDDNGVFLFEDIQMNQYGTHIKIMKAGYYDGSKFVSPELNQMSFVKVMMIARDLTGNFNSTSGGSVTTNGGAQVSIPSNGVTFANGSTYTGQVNVYATWIDPSSPQSIWTMPGDLRAIDGEDNFVQLATYGMVGVELESPSGEELQLADGTQATVEFPIPADILADAPASIPLWHFDEDSGYWEEEGTANREGNKYVGSVSHFSFWNCDAPFPLVHLSGSIVDVDGNPVAGVAVQIEFTSNNTVGYGYTNEEGVFSGKVPKNEPLVLNVLDNCGAVIYTADIGPFSADAVLDPIVFSSTENILTVSGTLTDCDSSPVSNGYVKVAYGGGYSTIFVEEDGSFTGTLSICSASEITVTGVDLDNQLQSSPATYNVEGLTDIDVGAIAACDELDEYFQYTIDGGDTEIATEVGTEYATDSMGNVTFIAIFAFSDSTMGGTNYSYIDLENIDLGDQTPRSMFFSDSSQPNGAGISCQLCDGMTVTITQTGNEGDTLIGTFDGTIDWQGNIYAISGSFKVIIGN